MRDCVITWQRDSRMLNASNSSAWENVSELDPSMPIDIVLLGTVSYSLIFACGIVGNILTIHVLTQRSEMRNFTNYLLANLSISDTLILLTCVPTGLHDLFAKERWYLGKTMCYLVLFIENCLGIVSIMSIFFITLERFYAICRPLIAKSLMSQSRTLRLIIFIWLLSVFINLPLIFMSEYVLEEFNNKQIDYMCIANTDQKFGMWRQYYSLFITFIIYLVIGVFLVVMYSKISSYLNESSMLLVSSIDSSKETAGAKSKFIRSSQGSLVLLKPRYQNEARLSINSNLEKYIKPRKQLITMLMYVIIVFYVCLYPLKVNILTFFKFQVNNIFNKIFF